MQQGKFDSSDACQLCVLIATHMMLRKNVSENVHLNFNISTSTKPENILRSDCNLNVQFHIQCCFVQVIALFKFKLYADLRSTKRKRKKKEPKHHYTQVPYRRE